MRARAFEFAAIAPRSVHVENGRPVWAVILTGAQTVELVKMEPDPRVEVKRNG